jgi:hypothetical protein
MEISMTEQQFEVRAAPTGMWLTDRRSRAGFYARFASIAYVEGIDEVSTAIGFLSGDVRLVVNLAQDIVDRMSGA